jgi:hypothetical protein
LDLCEWVVVGALLVEDSTGDALSGVLGVIAFVATRELLDA